MKGVRWVDLVHLSPEEAVAVMQIKLGRTILAADAADALQRARRRLRFAGSSIYSTRDDFKRSDIGKRLGGNVQTSDTYRMIIQRDSFSSAAAAA